MKTILRNTNLFKATLLVMGLLFIVAAFAQTTITSGQTVFASDIPVNNSVTINAGGTLDMDVARTFSFINTAGNGTSTISGTGTLTVNTHLTVGGNNTLSIAPAVTTTFLTAANLNNETATVSGAGSISAGSIEINGTDNNPTTLFIAPGLTVQAGFINGGLGNSNTTYNLTVSGTLKISGVIETGVTGVENFTCNNGSTVDYNGGAAQTVYNAFYYHLTLSGGGAKTLGGKRQLRGNFLLATGATLTLGGNDLMINVNANRTATINGTLNTNGRGRLREGQVGTKTLVLGPEGYISITGTGSASFLPAFQIYAFNANSKVEFGSVSNQTIESSVTYGHLITSGSGTKTFRGAGGTMTFAGDITINNGTKLASNNKTMNVAGNWKNNGEFLQGTSTVILNGSAIQRLEGSVNTNFNNLTINNAAGVSLFQNENISGVLKLTNGLVTPFFSAVLTMNEGSTVSGASNTSFVNGPMAKIGVTAFTFPVGKFGSGIRTIGITAPSTSSTFMAEFLRNDPHTLGATLGTGLTQISACEYWTLDRLVGTGNAETVLSWESASSCGSSTAYVTDLLSLRVAHFTGGMWVNEGRLTTSGSMTAGTITSNNSVGNFSPFALASSSSNTNSLPVVFADVKAYEKNNGVQIEWSNLTEKDVAKYTIERSANGRDFSSIRQQLPVSNQNDKADYNALDALPLSGVNYYRNKAEETPGKIVYSKILSVNTGAQARGMKLYPNPVSGNQLTISFTNLKRGQYRLRVINNAGQDVFRQIITNHGRSLTQTLDLPVSVKPGVYNMLVTGDDYRESKMFIVQ